MGTHLKVKNSEFALKKIMGLEDNPVSFPFWGPLGNFLLQVFMFNFGWHSPK